MTNVAATGQNALRMMQTQHHRGAGSKSGDSFSSMVEQQSQGQSQSIVSSSLTSQTQQSAGQDGVSQMLSGLQNMLDLLQGSGSSGSAQSTASQTGTTQSSTSQSSSSILASLGGL